MKVRSSIHLVAALAAAVASASSSEVTIFSSGEGGYHDFLNPSMVRLSSGKLLVFCEARKGSGGDGDPIDVGYKSSEDRGQTWSPLRSIVPNNSSNTLGNNVAFVVNETSASNGERVVLMFCANNTVVWQIHSDDSGSTWTMPRDMTHQVKETSEGWIATGPANGIVLASGRVLVPVDTNLAEGSIQIDFKLVPGSKGRNRQCPMASLEVGVRGAAPSALPQLHSSSGNKEPLDPCKHLDLAALFKLQQRAYMLISDDKGASWKRSDPLPLIASETAVAQLADGSLLARSRLGEDGWQDGCEHFVQSHDEGQTWQSKEVKHCIQTPGVQNSMLGRPSLNNSVLLASPRIDPKSSKTENRGNLTIYESNDNGASWRTRALVHVGSSEYSSMVSLGSRSVGIAFVADDRTKINFSPLEGV